MAITSTLAKQRRRQGILILSLAVLLVGGGLYYFLSSGETAGAPAPQIRPPGQIAMPVARGRLPRGTTLSLGRLTIVYRDPARVPEDAVINPDVFVGRWLLKDLPAGGYLRESDLAPTGAPKSFSGMVPPGRRVAVIRSDQIDGTYSYLAVGDMVDIVASYDPPPLGARRADFATSGTQPGAPPTPGSGPAPTAPGARGGVITLVAEAAAVLEAPRRMRNPANNSVQEFLVLAIDIDEAQRLEVAQLTGQRLRFIHRPFNEPKPSSPRWMATPSDPRTVEVIRGTERRSMQTQINGEPLLPGGQP